MRKLIGTLLTALVLAYLVYQFFMTQLVSDALQNALGVPVKVGRVHLKLAPVEFGIYGLKIGSPEGFEEKEMFSIPETFVRMNPLDLFKREIHVQQVHFNLEHVTVEKSRAGKISLKEFLDIPKKKAGERKPAPQAPQPQKPKPPPAPGKKSEPFFKLRVDEVIMSIGKITFVDYGSGQRVVREFPLNVDRMILKNVTDMDSLSEQVVMIVLKKIGVFVMGMQFDRIAQDVQAKLSQIFK